MFEASGRTNRRRIATLPGPTVSGELLTHVEIKEIVHLLTYTDDQCGAPLQMVRETRARRGHFRHVFDTGRTFRALESFGEGRWHREIKAVIFAEDLKVKNWKPMKDNVDALMK